MEGSARKKKSNLFGIGEIIRLLQEMNRKMDEKLE